MSHGVCGVPDRAIRSPSIDYHQSLCQSIKPRRRRMAAPPTVGSVLVPVKIEDLQQRQGVLDHATRSADRRVYLALQGPGAAQGPTTAALDALVHCFVSSAVLKPQLDVVPLFPCLGWTAEANAALDLNALSAARQDGDAYLEYIQRLNEARQRRELPPLPLTLVDDTPAAQPGSEPQMLQSRVIGDWEGPLEFNTVAVGGTFDRFHAGHRLLLAATALVARKGIFVGVTSDKLLANKKNKHLLQTYEVREAAAVTYMQRVNPNVQVTGGPLNDPAVPPLCATERDFDAIVVSEETVHGADAINGVRAQLGFRPLVIVVVGLITSQQRSVKLSSTDLRQIDAGIAAVR